MIFLHLLNRTLSHEWLRDFFYIHVCLYWLTFKMEGSVYTANIVNAHRRSRPPPEYIPIPVKVRIAMAENGCRCVEMACVISGPEYWITPVRVRFSPQPSFPCCVCRGQIWEEAMAIYLSWLSPKRTPSGEVHRTRSLVKIILDVVMLLFSNLLCVLVGCVFF